MVAPDPPGYLPYFLLLYVVSLRNFFSSARCTMNVVLLFRFRSSSLYRFYSAIYLVKSVICSEAGPRSTNLSPSFENFFSVIFCLLFASAYRGLSDSVSRCTVVAFVLDMVMKTLFYTRGSKLPLIQVAWLSCAKVVGSVFALRYCFHVQIDYDKSPDRYELFEKVVSGNDLSHMSWI